MSSIEDNHLSFIFNRQVKMGFIFAIIHLFILVPAWAGICLAVFIGALNSKVLCVIFVFSGWAFLMYRIFSLYRKSVVCPRCGNIYYLAKGFFTVPFVRSCQSCGLPLKPSNVVD